MSSKGAILNEPSPEDQAPQRGQSPEEQRVDEGASGFSTPQDASTWGVPGQRHASMLTQVTRRAMATEFVVMIPAHAVMMVELVVTTLERLDEMESRLTIYQPQSEVSQINERASREAVHVSEPTFRLLERSLQWSERTQGAFDITAGPLVQAWGFTQRRGKKPTTEEIEIARRRVGYKHLKLDGDAQAVRFAQPDMSINLGAIGKGDALDQIANTLREEGLHDFLIHGGNSSILAAGDQMAGSGEGWSVGLAHPTKPKRRLAGLRLRNQALATSGSGKQFFHHRGRRYGHVIDPRTGNPSGDLSALTVLMDSAADADACATGLFVAGSEVIRDLMPCPWLTGLVMMQDGDRQDSIRVESFGEIDWVEPPQENVSRIET